MNAGETALGVSRATPGWMLRVALMLLVLSPVLRLRVQAYALGDTTLWLQQTMILTMVGRTRRGRARLLVALALGLDALAM